MILFLSSRLGHWRTLYLPTLMSNLGWLCEQKLLLLTASVLLCNFLGVWRHFVLSSTCLNLKLQSLAKSLRSFPSSICTLNWFRFWFMFAAHSGGLWWGKDDSFYYIFLLSVLIDSKAIDSIGCIILQVGAELVFRVLGCKSKRITVTHKKTLVCSFICEWHY